jgi:hypothetical protein
MELKDIVAQSAKAVATKSRVVVKSASGRHARALSRL